MARSHKHEDQKLYSQIVPVSSRTLTGPLDVWFSVNVEWAFRVRVMIGNVLVETRT